MSSNGRLIKDIPVSNNQSIYFGKRFKKTWLVENSGMTQWDDAICLVFLRGTELSGKIRHPVPAAAPGQTVEISLPMRAPSHPGDFAADWRLQEANGRFFGPVLQVKFKTIQPPPPPPMTSNGRYLADINIPDGSTLKAGSTFIKTWLVENNGSTAWGKGFKLVHIGGELMGRKRNFSLPPAEPGQRVNVSIPMTAPNKMWRIISRWRMQDDRGRFFGQHLYADVFVVADKPSSPPTTFDPAAWRDTIWAITSIFESGSPAGDPAAFQTFDAGIISYGRHQATLASGTLALVMAAYFERSQTAVSQTLQAEFADRIGQRDPSLRKDGQLKELLLAAAKETAMIEAQDAVFDGRYYQPAIQQARAHNLLTPLALACLYDTQVQGGLFILLPRVVEKLDWNAAETGSEENEAGFIAAFLEEREARLNKLADQFEAKGNLANAQALRISTFRVEEYRNLLAAGNLSLAGPLTIRGQVVAGIS